MDVILHRTTFVESKSTYRVQQISPEVNITRTDTAVSSTNEPLFTTEKVKIYRLFKNLFRSFFINFSEMAYLLI